MVIGFERIPLWLFGLLPGLGALLITSLVYSGGADAAAAYATIYFWAVLSAFYFFEHAARARDAARLLSSAMPSRWRHTATRRTRRSTGCWSPPR